MELAGLDRTDQGNVPKLPPFEQRVHDVFPGALFYDFGYRMTSASVHGTWKDLLDRHVTGDGAYTPILGWREADPGFLLTTILLVAPVVAAYADHLGTASTRETRDQVEELADQAARVNGLYDRLHESGRTPEAG